MGRVRSGIVGSVGLALLAANGALLLGCSGGGSSTFPGVGGNTSVPPIGTGGSAQLRRVVPTDTRPVVSAEAPPPPISGGTLGTTADGAYVVVADSDRDRIVMVEVATRQVAQEIALEPGDEPGRVTAGTAGQAFVALRRGGAVVTVDATQGLLARRPACLAPRGLAYDAALDQLHVACAEGQLVSFTGAELAPSRVLTLDVDLRDVVLSAGRLLVSRLRSAELLEVAADGTLLQRFVPPTLQGTVIKPSPSTPVAESDVPTTMPVAQTDAPAVPNAAGAPTPGFPMDPTTAQEPFAPAVAWRTVASADGSVHMLHQRGRKGPVPVSHGEDDQDVFMDPYGGGGNPCGSIVRSGVTRFGSDGSVQTAAAPSLPLAVDAALSPNGRYLAVASAGLVDFNAPQPTFEVVSEGSDMTMGMAGSAPAVGGIGFGGSGLQVLMVSQPSSVSTGDAPPPLPLPPSADAGVPPASDPPPTDPNGEMPVPPPDPFLESADRCDFDSVGVFVPEPVVAVAFDPHDGAALYAQTRVPSQLYFIDMVSGIAEPLALGGVSVDDTAHDLFHRSATAGLACASCHPEGMDDGLVWEFEGLGLRRTQALDIGLAGTAPFHWDGTLENVSALMDEVFIGRMGGVFQSPERLAALENWIFTLQPLPARRAADDAQAVRGGELFHSEAVGCGNCHSGAAFTNNLSYAVGTTPAEELLQVPGLAGIGYRAPLMHDGCALTLADRFNPQCGGGDAHGVTSNLPPEDIAALVAYLETL